MLRLVNNTRQRQLSWLQAIQEETGWNQSELARRAGISHATLSKFRNDPNNAALLDTAIVAKIVAVSPIPHYELQVSTFPDGFQEGEAEEVTGEPYSGPMARAIAAMRHGAQALDPWVLRSRVLEYLGYVPGDVLMVDLSLLPSEGDVVCAQVSDRRGRVDTAFRVFHPPYLVAATGDKRFLKPLLIDDHVAVMGVVVTSLRPRLSRLAS